MNTTVIVIIIIIIIIDRTERGFPVKGGFRQEGRSRENEEGLLVEEELQGSVV